MQKSFWQNSSSICDKKKKKKEILTNLIEIIQSIFSDYNEIKQEINNQKRSG